MTQSLTAHSTPKPASTKILQRVGALGTLLALAILGASILLRLTSVIGADGVVHSNLSIDQENAVRLVHRLAAASVGLLAMLVTVLGWTQRKAAPHALRPVMWMVGATVLLAVIGPLTPGYRFSAVTVANVVAGTVLLGSCWWLHEALAVGRASTTAVPDRMLRMTLAVFVVHIGLGAAASAVAMHGTHWVAFVHSGSAMLTTMLLGSVLWDRRSHAGLATVVGAMTGLLALQVMLGVASLWVDGRPVGLGFVHAMLSPLLAGGLVSISVRDPVGG